MLMRLSVALDKDFDYFVLDTPYVRRDRVIDSEISDKMEKCSPATQAPALQALEGACPGGLVFLHPSRGAQDFTASVFIHRDRCQNGHISYTPPLAKKPTDFGGSYCRPVMGW